MSDDISFIASTRVARSDAIAFSLDGRETFDESAVLAAVPYAVLGGCEALEAKRLSRMAARLERNERLQRRFTSQVYREFLEQGGEAGDWPAFVQFLIDNWELILRIIASLLLVI